jgi:predicted unusual protein kinase regulating ubiquinone biosynthesis (AarF/ABC1/UbiB family)
MADKDAYRDDNNFSGRAKRYARVSTSMGGVVAKAAGKRLLGREMTTILDADDLKQALGGLKGPLMKVGQILATVPDLIPEEYSRELKQLQSNAPPMGWAFVKRRMRAELGPDWQDRFQSFEQEACAAASLGQVHKAVALDGTQLACKIQYPDMGSAVEADLRQLKLVFSIYRRYDKAIDPTDIHAELSERLREELDYGRELRQMQLYDHILRDEAGVHVPAAYPDVSTKRLLSMQWLDGTPMMSHTDRTLEDRNHIALNMFRAWYVPFYNYGIIHGDPHLGNYSVRDDGAINLLDFGCIRVFPADFVGAVIDLYKALRDDDPDLAVHAYETWGFSDLERETIDILNMWARFLYGPVLKDETRSIQEEGGTQYGASVAAKVHKALREKGGVKPPREFVLMDRAAIGLGSVFTYLNAEVNWHRLFHEVVDGFDVERLRARQTEALTAHDLPTPV